MDVGCHIGKNSLLLQPELENISIHHGLDLVLEDIAAFSGAATHPMVRTVLQVVNFIHLLGSPWLRKFDAATFHQQFEECVNVVIIEGG